MFSDGRRGQDSSTKLGLRARAKTRPELGQRGRPPPHPLPAATVHPHMLRHACGYKLANDGQDTRALQHYLGHKNIQHTVRYTELSPKRFKNFWKD
jgi:integrase